MLLPARLWFVMVCTGQSPKMLEFKSHSAESTPSAVHVSMTEWQEYSGQNAEGAACSSCLVHLFDSWSSTSKLGKPQGATAEKLFPGGSGSPDLCLQERAVSLCSCNMQLLHLKFPLLGSLHITNMRSPGRSTRYIASMLSGSNVSTVIPLA